MRDKKLLTLAEPLVELSPYYTGRFTGKPDKSFIPPNAPELALNEATDNFKRQMDYNRRLIEHVKGFDQRLNVCEWIAISAAIVVLGLLIVVVFRY